MSGNYFPDRGRNSALNPEGRVGPGAWCVNWLQNKVDQKKKKKAEKTNEGQVFYGQKTLYIHISLHSADINHP